LPCGRSSAKIRVACSFHPELNAAYAFRWQGNSALEPIGIFMLELPWIASTYLVGTNESGNQKGNLSYLAGTKKRSIL
jgi:hypothetical protein